MHNSTIVKIRAYLAAIEATNDLEKIDEHVQCIIYWARELDRLLQEKKRCL